MQRLTRLLFAGVDESLLRALPANATADQRAAAVTVANLQYGVGSLRDRACVLCLHQWDNGHGGSFSCAPIWFSAPTQRRQVEHLLGRHPYMFGPRAATLPPPPPRLGAPTRVPGYAMVSQSAKLASGMVHAVWSSTSDAAITDAVWRCPAAARKCASENESALQKCYHSARCDDVPSVRSTLHGSSAIIVNILRGHFAPSASETLLQELFSNAGDFQASSDIIEGLMCMRAVSLCNPLLMPFHCGSLLQYGRGGVALRRACRMLTAHVRNNTQRTGSLLGLLPDAWLYAQDRVDAATWSGYNNVALRSADGKRVTTPMRREFGAKNVLRLTAQDVAAVAHILPGLAQIVAAAAAAHSSEAAGAAEEHELFNVHLLQQERVVHAGVDSVVRGLGAQDWHADTGTAEADGEGQKVRRTYIILASPEQDAPGVEVGGLQPVRFEGEGCWVSFRSDLVHRTSQCGQLEQSAQYVGLESRPMSLKVVIKFCSQ